MPNFTRPELKTLHQSTLIGELPSISNDNNDALMALLDAILSYGSDDGDGYVKVPVYTKGKVEGDTGKFKNLICDGQLTIKNTDNITVGIGNVTYDDGTGRTLKEVMTAMDSSIGELYKALTLAHLFNDGAGVTADRSIKTVKPVKTEQAVPSAAAVMPTAPATLTAADANRYLAALDADVSYTYPLKYYMIKVSYDPDKFRYKADYADTVKGEKFRYYEVGGAKYLKIDNELPACLRGMSRGDTVSMIFDPKTELDFTIRLNDGTGVKVKKSDAEVTQLTLVCAGVDGDGRCDLRIISASGKIEKA